MLLVIFGAGASYDSYYPSPSESPTAEYFEGARPPLTQELFDRGFDYALSEFWQMRPLAAHLRRLPKEALLEAELARLFDQRNAQPSRFRQFVALRFYLQRIIAQRTKDWLAGTAGVTNYVELLGRIDDWRLQEHQRVALVTFNYDTLLDEAYKDILNSDPARPKRLGVTRLHQPKRFPAIQAARFLELGTPHHQPGCARSRRPASNHFQCQRHRPWKSIRDHWEAGANSKSPGGIHPRRWQVADDRHRCLNRPGFCRDTATLAGLTES